MKYEAIGQFSGFAARRVELTAQAPWLYIIVAPAARLIYIGETYDPNGLVVRLASHFGPFVTSTFRQRALDVGGVASVKPPYLIVSARLPMGDEPGGFDGSSKQVRLLCEALLHERIANAFAGAGQGWAIISAPSRTLLTASDQHTRACESITERFRQAFAILRGLQGGMPFALVILDSEAVLVEQTELSLGEILEGIEVRLHDWIISALKNEFGTQWWTDGIPQQIRMSCSARMEEEGTRDIVPPEAYLTLIELRSVIQKNWNLFRPAMEAIAVGVSGKDRATEWLVEVNDLRKVWAHPLKQRYKQPDPARVANLRILWPRLLEQFQSPIAAHG